MIEARIVLDSVNEWGTRLTTIEATFHRFILPALNTHRVFSRNTTSSRAETITARIEQVQANPAIPVSFGTKKKGMQAGPPLQGEERDKAVYSWLKARDAAAQEAVRLRDLGVHKEVVNRILEPWTWTTAIVSATEWDNFFHLRCDDDAQPEMQMLANAIRDALESSVPTEIPSGGWHTPYMDSSPEIALEDRLRASAARCARGSYGTQGIDRPIEEDLQLFQRIINHDSPKEHVAQAEKGQHPGNFGYGWLQLRHHEYTKGNNGQLSNPNPIQETSL